MKVQATKETSCEWFITHVIREAGYLGHRDTGTYGIHRILTHEQGSILWPKSYFLKHGILLRYLEYWFLGIHEILRLAHTWDTDTWEL